MTNPSPSGGSSNSLPFAVNSGAVQICPGANPQDISIQTAAGEVLLSLTGVSSCGTITIQAYRDSSSQMPSGFQAVPTNYDISENGTGVTKVTVTVPYLTNEINEINAPVNSLRLLHYTNGRWTDVTTQLNKQNQTITGNLDTFSPLRIGIYNIASCAISINNGALFTNSLSNTIFSSIPEAEEILISNDAGFIGADWQPYQSASLWEISNPGDRIVTLNVYARVHTANHSALCSGLSLSDDIIYDHLPPIVTFDFAATVSAINGIIQGAEVSPISIKVTSTDQVGGSGVAEMQVSNSATFTGARWVTYSPTAVIQASPSDIIYVRTRDRVGNVSQVYSSLMKLPGSPTLVAPLNLSFTSDNTPSFNWNPVIGVGITYQIQIDNLATFGTPIDVNVTGLTNPNYTAPLLSDGLKYWRVRALNNAITPEPGSWSLTRNFTIDSNAPLPPAPSLPLNNAAGIRATPTFTWLASVTANAYQFQYDEAADFADPFYTSEVVPVLTHKPSPNMGLGTWYWRVKSRDAVGNWSNWSSHRIITILPLIPVAPVVVSPASASYTNDNTPDLSWNPVTGSASYEIQIDNMATFAAPIDQTSKDLLPTSYTATALTDGLKYWRVRAYNIANEPGAWSTARYFIIDTVPQAVPVMVAPANGATLLTTIPTMTVKAVVGAKYYQFQVDDAEDFDTPLLDLTKTTVSAVPTIAQALPFGTNYWRVRSIDAAGNPSGWSTPRSFVVTILKTPANLTYTTVVKPVFSWAAAAGALSYRIQVDDSELFDLPEMDVTRPVSVSYIPLTALPYNIYYWRMQVQTAAGWSNWTPVQTFTVTPALPLAPILTTPATASITNDNTPVLNWNSVTNGVAYQVQISKAATFLTLEQNVTLEPGVLTYTAEPLSDGLHYWRVRAVNSLNVPGAWAVYRYFVVDTIPQAVPVLVAPANGATVLTTIPTMTVKAVVGAKYYQFQVDDAEDFATPIIGCNQNHRLRRSNNRPGPALWYELLAGAIDRRSRERIRVVSAAILRGDDPENTREPVLHDHRQTGILLGGSSWCGELSHPGG